MNALRNPRFRHAQDHGRCARSARQLIACDGQPGPSPRLGLRAGLLDAISVIRAPHRDTYCSSTGPWPDPFLHRGRVGAAAPGPNRDRLQQRRDETAVGKDIGLVVIRVDPAFTRAVAEVERLFAIRPGRAPSRWVVSLRRPLGTRICTEMVSLPTCGATRPCRSLCDPGHRRVRLHRHRTSFTSGSHPRKGAVVCVQADRCRQPASGTTSVQGDFPFRPRGHLESRPAVAARMRAAPTAARESVPRSPPESHVDRSIARSVQFLQTNFHRNVTNCSIGPSRLLGSACRAPKRDGFSVSCTCRRDEVYGSLQKADPACCTRPPTRRTPVCGVQCGFR